MKLIHRVLIVLCAILFVSHARADLIVPGTKSVEHSFVIEASPLLANYDLVAFPVRGFNGAERIVPGTAFTTAKSKYGTKVYALAKETVIPEDVRAEWFADKLCATIPVQVMDSVPISSLTTSIKTTLVVNQLSPAGFTLAEAAEERERDLVMLPLIAGAVIFGLLGFVVLRRKRRA